MNDYSTLELTLRDILRVISPLEEDWAKRFQFINELRAVLESVESLRGATVEPYGSFVSNLFTRWGDLDISIELPNGSFISSAGKKLKQTLLGDLQKALRRRGGWYKLQFIANARVPILKFESNYLNISCDVSINNLNGQMKSKLLFWINEIDGRFHNMVLLVKEWAKTHGVRAVAERHIEEICAENINKFRSDKSRKINRSSLSELFISFLKKCSLESVSMAEGGLSMVAAVMVSVCYVVDRAGPSDLQSFSESLKSRFNSMSMRYKETISKGTRGWRERLFSRSNTSMADIGSEVRREVNAGIASVSRLLEHLETRENSRADHASASHNLAGPSVTEQLNQNNVETRHETSRNDSSTAAIAASSVSN